MKETELTRAEELKAIQATKPPPTPFAGVLACSASVAAGDLVAVSIAVEQPGR
jgi:hypothetical protein